MLYHMLILFHTKNKKNIWESVCIHYTTRVRNNESAVTYYTRGFTVCSRLGSKQSWISRNCRSCQTWASRRLGQGRHDCRRKLLPYSHVGRQARWQTVAAAPSTAWPSVHHAPRQREALPTLEQIMGDNIIDKIESLI